MMTGENSSEIPLIKWDAFNKEANNRAEIFLAEQFCPTIKKELSLELSVTLIFT